MEYPDPGIGEREAAVPGLPRGNPHYGHTIQKIVDECDMKHGTDSDFSTDYRFIREVKRHAAG